MKKRTVDEDYSVQNGRTHTHTHRGSDVHRGAQWEGSDKQETQSQSKSQDRKPSEVETQKDAHSNIPRKRER